MANPVDMYFSWRYVEFIIRMVPGLILLVKIGDSVTVEGTEVVHSVARIVVVVGLYVVGLYVGLNVGLYLGLYVGLM